MLNLINQSPMPISTLSVYHPAKVVELHHASSTEDAGDNFVILPPEGKKKELQAVLFSDGKAIRREITRVNQLNSYEVVQMVPRGEETPKYFCSDPRNSCKLPT